VKSRAAVKGIKPFTPIRATRNVVVAAAEAEAVEGEVEVEDPAITAFRDASEAEAEIELEEVSTPQFPINGLKHGLNCVHREISRRSANFT
jgi:hypothetical protein